MIMLAYNFPMSYKSYTNLLFTSQNQGLQRSCYRRFDNDSAAKYSPKTKQKHTRTCNLAESKLDSYRIDHIDAKS